LRLKEHGEEKGGKERRRKKEKKEREAKGTAINVYERSTPTSAYEILDDF